MVIRYVVTSYCLTRGTMRITSKIHSWLTLLKSPNITFVDINGDTYDIGVDLQRMILTNMQPFYEAHNLEPNDSIFLHLEDATIIAEAVKATPGRSAGRNNKLRDAAAKQPPDPAPAEEDDKYISSPVPILQSHELPSALKSLFSQLGFVLESAPQPWIWRATIAGHFLKLGLYLTEKPLTNYILLRNQCPAHYVGIVSQEKIWEEEAENIRRARLVFISLEALEVMQDILAASTLGRTDFLALLKQGWITADALSVYTARKSLPREWQQISKIITLLTDIPPEQPFLFSEISTIAREVGIEPKTALEIVAFLSHPFMGVLTKLGSGEYMLPAQTVLNLTTVAEHLTNMAKVLASRPPSLPKIERVERIVVPNAPGKDNPW